jgi:hypothetical protein
MIFTAEQLLCGKLSDWFNIVTARLPQDDDYPAL